MTETSSYEKLLEMLGRNSQKNDVKCEKKRVEPETEAKPPKRKPKKKLDHVEEQPVHGNDDDEEEHPSDNEEVLTFDHFHSQFDESCVAEQKRLVTALGSYKPKAVELGKVFKTEYYLENELKNTELDVCQFKQKLKKALKDLPETELEYLKVISSYSDLLSCIGSDLAEAYCLHSINHVLKTRSKVLKNNEKVKLNEDM